MSQPAIESLLSELGELLAGDDARRSLERALARLTELGISDELRAALAPLFRLARLRLAPNKLS